MNSKLTGEGDDDVVPKKALHMTRSGNRVVFEGPRRENILEAERLLKLSVGR